MSRHRFVKNLDLDDELDDFEGEEDNDDDYDPNEDPQMREGLIRAREVLENDFTDREIQESLWHTYYDVEKTVDYLLSRWQTAFAFRASSLSARSENQNPFKSLHGSTEDEEASRSVKFSPRLPFPIIEN